MDPSRTQLTLFKIDDMAYLAVVDWLRAGWPVPRIGRDACRKKIQAKMREIDTVKIYFLRKSFVSAKHLRENFANFAKTFQRD